MRVAADRAVRRGQDVHELYHAIAPGRAVRGPHLATWPSATRYDIDRQALAMAGFRYGQFTGLLPGDHDADATVVITLADGIEPVRARLKSRSRSVIAASPRGRLCLRMSRQGQLLIAPVPRCQPGLTDLP